MLTYANVCSHLAAVASSDALDLEIGSVLGAEARRVRMLTYADVCSHLAAVASSDALDLEIGSELGAEATRAEGRRGGEEQRALRAKEVLA